MSNACRWKPGTVTLADGRQVLSDSPEWLAECEARYILNIPNKPARIALLDAIEKKRGAGDKERGAKARKELEDRVLALWEMRRKGAA